jgi:hypothetical protein
MRRWWIDTGERVVSTAVGAFLAVMVARLSGTDAFSDVDWRTALDVSSLAALVSLIKAILATRVGDKNSAALLPADKS